MKLTAQMVVINEEDYVYYALKSIYDVVEKIVIIEGAATNRFGKDAVERGFVLESGLSADRTHREINRILDEDVDKKIDYIQYGWTETVNNLREYCHSKVDEDTDYNLIIDSDALYKAEEIQRLRNLVETHPSIWMIAAKELMFFLDLNHILTVDQEHLQLCNYIDSGLFWKHLPNLKIFGQRPYYNSNKMESFLKRVSVQGLDKIQDEERLYLFEPNGVFDIFHYGWVHTASQMEQHILRWAHATRNMVRRGGGDERIKRWCTPILDSNDEEILEYYRTYHKIWTGIYDESVGEHLEIFQGEHPSIIRFHPYFGKNAEEMGWLI